MKEGLRTYYLFSLSKSISFLSPRSEVYTTSPSAQSSTSTNPQIIVLTSGVDLHTGHSSRPPVEDPTDMILVEYNARLSMSSAV
jgi:hypothetical protein